MQPQTYMKIVFIMGIVLAVDGFLIHGIFLDYSKYGLIRPDLSTVHGILGSVMAIIAAKDMRLF